MRGSLAVFAAVALLSTRVSAQDPADPRRWRTGQLADSGKPYWWRPSLDETEPEITFTEPEETWKLGQLDSGMPYIWRTGENGKPEVQIWRQGTLDSGAPFWWRTKSGALQEVRLSDPYEEATMREVLAARHDEL